MAASTNARLRALAKDVCRMLRRSPTPAERLLWEALRDRRFHGLKVYRQYALFVDWHEAETFFVADFFCFEARLVIEVDGKIHDYRTDHDQLRTFIINQLGIRVLRVRNEEVEDDLEGVLRRLEGAVGSAGER